LFGAPGNQIDVSGVQASSLSYDAATHMLSLLGQGGTLGAFEVTSPLLLGTADFALSSDQNGGSLLTYAPDTPLTL
jgi:hypothetical protein